VLKYDVICFIVGRGIMLVPYFNFIYLGNYSLYFL